MEPRAKKKLVTASIIGTILQIAMVVIGHFEIDVAALFGPIGCAISLIAGLLALARGPSMSLSVALVSGAIAGGVCAFIGIIVSFALGDVAAPIIAIGTLSSAVTGAVGGAIGRYLK